MDDEETKLSLTVVDTTKKFVVQVKDGNKVVEELDWYGGHSNGHTSPFEYKGKMYVVFGPFHAFQGVEDYRLFEMKEVAKV